MPILFAFTLFISALLLFMVQPMIGRMILPLLGGSPAAWNTCMVFFQFVLLLGYLYAHKLSSRLSTRQQVYVHAGVLAAAMLAFTAAIMLGERGTPIAVVKSLAPQNTAYPMFGVLALLAVAIGVPFFAVSTTAPLLQRWFAGSGHRTAADPYFLYAASNAGSLLSLVAYPFITEPNLTLNHQAWVFAAGFAVLAGFILYCGFTVPNAAAVKTTVDPVKEPPPSNRRIFKWVMLAFVPSSLMLGVTFYLTTDLPPIPLLWVMPLALYLLTFIIAFARTPAWLRLVLGNAAPVAALLLLFVIITRQPLPSLVLTVGLHLLAFFLIALMCHYELAHDRPSTAYLTNFFLWISVGGVLGGIFNALLAPILFPLPWEYSIAICVGCIMVPKFKAEEKPPTKREKELYFFGDLLIPLSFLTGVMVISALGDWRPYVSLLKNIGDAVGLDRMKVQDGVQWALPLIGCFFFIDRPIRFGLCVAAVVFVGEFRRAAEEQHTQRSFFGIYKIQREPRDPTKDMILRKLVHGTTLHGQQGWDPWPLRNDLKDPIRALVGPWAVDVYDWRGEPLTYYHRTGPVGHMFAAARERHKHPKVAMVGLGTGSAAAYADDRLDLTFFEIDPVVKQLVADRTVDPYFTFILDAKARRAKIDFVIGDARLMLEKMPDAKYDLLMIDAFSSDAIPVHLLTKEAIELYLDRLTGGGILALHISNKYIRLDEVVAKLAEELGLTALHFDDRWIDWENPNDEGQYQISPPGKTQSGWVVLAKNPKLLEPFLQDDRFTTNYRWVQKVYVKNTVDGKEKLEEEARDLNVASETNRWVPLKADPVMKTWTDDFSDVLMVSMMKEIQTLRRWLGYPIPKSIRKDLFEKAAKK